MDIRISYRVGRNIMGHHVVNGKLGHFIRGWDCLCSALDIKDVDWKDVDNIAMNSFNPDSVEIHISFKVNTSETQK